MLKEKVILYFLALMLTCTGIGLTVYKINSLHFPFFPNERVPVWTIGATISFEATGKPVSVMLNLPTNNTDLSILDYSESSDGYGFNTFMRENREYAKWTKREASGRQTIYFSMNVLENHETTGPFDHNDFFQPDPSTVILSNEEQQVAERLIKKSYNQSADNLSFAVELIKLVNAKES